MTGGRGGAIGNARQVVGAFENVISNNRYCAGAYIGS